MIATSLGQRHHQRLPWAACLLLVLLALACDQDIEPRVEGGLLEFKRPTLDGGWVSSSDARLKGQVVLLDLWGTWCSPCLESLPFLEKLHEELSGQGLVILGMAFETEENVDARRARLREFAEENAISYPILDGGLTSDRPQVLPALKAFQGYPTMIIIGRDGRVSHANTVFVPRELPRIRREVQRALKTQP